ncbi:hypothetical protein [Collinsella provencensis]|uniref:hypothetical protein n=1 Tax=Collinsella provencensis TaxID=1937461 RepID=UPI00131C8348|nr:hypothetical protein [Collinsella provencensis]
MTAFSMISKPALKAVSRLSSSLTYEEVPCAVDKRADRCAYLGHIPFFAPKSTEDNKR